jgi:hypothetical protein
MGSGISQQDLQERLAYDASTGVFTWRSESRCWGGRRVFSARLYGSRSKKNKQLMDALKDATCTAPTK